MSTLELRNVSFSYNASRNTTKGKFSYGVSRKVAENASSYNFRFLVSSFNLAVESHERVALHAPSGFGKTTICRLLAGYLQPQAGEVLLDGKPLTFYRGYTNHKVSNQPQKATCYSCPYGDFYASAPRKSTPGIFGSRSSNVSSASLLTSLPVQMIWQHPEQTLDPLLRIRDSLEEAGPLDQALLEKLGIKQKWLSRFPRELSGGELQRCCIARALRVHPKFFIADEISTMLDAITQVQIWDFLLSYCEENEVGLVLVTHSEALQNRLATRVVNLTNL